MSRKIINVGTTADDGNGEPLRTILQNINLMTSELYDIRGKYLDMSSFTVSDDDDLYAHESQIIIQKIGNKEFLLVMYMSNKVSADEWGLDAHAILNVFELTQKKFIVKLDLFYPGLVAGVTMAADKVINVPRMYVTGTTLRCYCPNTSTLYTRDIDISDDDPTGWTPGNIAIAQMTMKDAGGSNVLADVTSDNINIHLDYIFGDNAANYHDLMPLFRNLDMPAKSGNNWYATLECSGEQSHGLARPTLCVVSADAGVSWTLSSPIGYTIASRVQCVESAIFFVGTVLHIITRTGTHYISANNGTTWTLSTNVNTMAGVTISQSKPTGINYTPTGGSASACMAVQLASEITGNTYRTTLGIYTTTDMVTFTEVSKIITTSFSHYPCLCYAVGLGGRMYISYTKSLRAGTTDKDTIVVTRLW
jgi:hypothetical protein